MKVLFDHLCFNQRHGGVPRYFVELIKRLPSNDVIMTVRFSNNEYLKEIDLGRLSSFLPGLTFRGKPRIENSIGKLFSIPALIKNNFDIYHQTHYDPYAYRYLNKNVKIVTTIHDMNYWTISGYYSANNRKKQNQLVSAIKADHIITVSENSKEDLCKHLNIPEKKVSVVYHGISTDQYNETDAYDSPDPYILFVGSRNEYKNFEGIIKSFARLKKKYPDLKLYCAGSPVRKPEIMILKELQLSDSVIFIQASNRQLISLYKGAKVFVFPSFYEGFGIPILEAMAANCPIALSNTSSFPEVAQDAGAYFNPHDVDHMTSVIDNLLNNEQYRRSLIEKGNKRIKEFSWDNCARRHLEIYNYLI